MLGILGNPEVLELRKLTGRVSKVPDGIPGGGGGGGVFSLALGRVDDILLGAGVGFR